MMELLGVYECKIDAKGRVSVPSSLKKQLISIGTAGFVLKRSVFSKCLELHTQKEWIDLTKSIKKLNRFVQKNNEFIRIFHAGIKQVEMDSAGRILISKDLIGFANLKNTIVFSATPFGLEIWNQSDYEKAVSVENTDFVKLTEEVMGEPNSNVIS
ncbi:MAG: division/cell wall cluster transcriptional repressor MraZ [Schleiferiaceae bacterium]|nr:division/cell wall cluster transcriptional repressor MraZ [Schleiferiaceae bacterium]